ncbi:hypothetical protein EPN44_09690 [bacterium]|nr:MAG: hypothetical protein EPN44_09690 [bacterium]
MRETRELHAEDAVETGAIVLPRDYRGQLDQLRLVEALAQPLRQLARDLSWRLGHGDGQVQHQAFIGVEGLAALVAR